MIPDHLSYSSLSSYTSCPRAYYLSRVKQGERLPAWYFIVGSAVHEAIATYVDVADSSPALVEGLFMEEVEKSMEVEPDISKWMHGGSEDEPVVEERALKLALDCFENAILFLEDMDVWQVEYDATGHLPGCTMEIKAFIDLIGEHKKHGPIIGDWKTGKNKPKDSLQLETYNCLYIGHARMKMSPADTGEFKGLYIMLNPDASKARPVTFKHTPESLGKKYAEVEAKINQKIAKPNPQFNCKFCDMMPNCSTMSGSNPRTRYYDTPIKDGWLPF